VRLDSQACGKTIDYRLPFYLAPFPVEPIELPDKIQKKLFLFMMKSNLLFGCFDFIINKSGNWVFLEVNPTGQFLWIEESCPYLPLLNTFCNLLISPEEPHINKTETLYLSQFIAQEEMLSDTGRSVF